MGSKKDKKKKQKAVPEIDDERFRAAVNRPQFSKPKQDSSKVVLDDRFASVLTDPRFRLAEKDKYGRKQSKEQPSEELNAFYKVETQDNDDNDDKSNESSVHRDEPVERESDEESVKEDPAARIKYLTALSRGELSVSSSSSEEEEESDSDDSDSSDEENVEHTIYGTAGVLDPSSREQEEITLTQTPSPFIAVMDMDWKHVRAVDLFAILSSFTPPGAVRRVQIFPSNFGLERMAKEKQYGPENLWTKKNKDNEEEDSSESDGDEPVEEDSESEDNSVDVHEQYLKQLRIENEEKESDFDAEKLRAYEASKLKYYFAVVEFASSEYADVAYREVDGMELEYSSAAMDLRSIPPDELDGVIKDRELRDEATSIPSKYQPPAFVVSALQQSSVKCTWEDGDEERQRKLTAYGAGQPDAWGEAIEEDDLRAYLASDVSTSDEDEAGDESDDGGGKGSKMRKMLGLDESDEDDGRSTSSSEDGDNDNDFSKEVTFIPGKAKLEDRIRSKLEAKNEKELTPWEKYQQKRKEKRRERKQARRKLRKGFNDPTEDGSMYDSESDDDIAGVDDDFFLDADEEKPKASATKFVKKKVSKTQDEIEKATAPSTKEELELLLAGDNGTSTD